MKRLCFLNQSFLFLNSKLLVVLGLASITASKQLTTKVSNNMSTPKVLVTNPTTPVKGINLLKERGVDVLVLDSDEKENILKNVKGVDAIFWSSYKKLDTDILNAAGDNLKVVSTMSAGYNHIDTAELKKRDIKLSNTPSVLNEAVADMAILLALGASRRIHEGRLAIEQKKWQTKDRQWLLGQDISGSTVGIIGLGGIGQTVVKRMKGFGVGKFIYTGHTEKPEGKELGAKFVSLDNLVRTSDFIVVCVRLTNETEGMCNDDFFAKMKKTAVFIIVSRGTVVDQPALIKALKCNTIFAAGLDVMTPEPLPSDHELLKIPNLVIVPHLGSATVNTRNAMSELTAQNILRALGGEELCTPRYF